MKFSKEAEAYQNALKIATTPEEKAKSKKSFGD
jgi:hypothetical protein